MSLPQIIGLSGVARSGKDTVGKILHDLYGYGVFSFSETLHDALIALDPWVGPLIVNFGRESTFSRYSALDQSLGYERMKGIEEVRRLLQAMGTEVGRNMLGEDIWVDALFRKIEEEGGKAAIVNVRFPNEWQAVKDRGGVIWKVDRPGYGPALGHVSDTALTGFQFDQHFYNDDTIEDLAQKVVTTLEGR